MSKTTTRTNGRADVIGIAYTLDEIPTQNLRALAEADVIVGHADFIESVRSAIRADAETFDVLDESDTHHDFRRKRVEAVFAAARAGRNAALVVSGDPGVWGMASYVAAEYSRAKAEHDSDEFFELRILPALSAFQIAAAKVGGPLMRGFAACALCDDIVSEAEIFKKLTGARDAEFVTVVYKPRFTAEDFPEFYPVADYPEMHPPRKMSNERLKRMLELFASSGTDLPVVLAADLGEPSEAINIRSVVELRDDVESIPFSSILIVGNSQTSLADGLLSVADLA